MLRALCLLMLVAAGAGCVLVLHASPGGGHAFVLGLARGCTVFRVVLRSRGARGAAQRIAGPASGGRCRGAVVSAFAFDRRDGRVLLGGLRCPECLFNQAAYAQFAGLELLVADSAALALGGRSGYYVKIHVLREALRSHDPVAWVDADAWVSDFGLCPHDFFDPARFPATRGDVAGAAMAVQDGRWLNTCAMVFRPSNWTDFVLVDAWRSAPRFPAHPAEQVALQQSVQRALQIAGGGAPTFACAEKGNGCWVRGLPKTACDHAFYCLSGRPAPFLVAVPPHGGMVLACAHYQPAFHDALKDVRPEGKCLGSVFAIHPNAGAQREWRRLEAHRDALGFAELG